MLQCLREIALPRMPQTAMIAVPVSSEVAGDGPSEPSEWQRVLSASLSEGADAVNASDGATQMLIASERRE